MSKQTRTKKQTDTPAKVEARYLRRQWADNNNYTYVEIGKAMGVKGPTVSIMMCRGVAPQEHIDVLRDTFGMPEHLLPRPSRGKRGPKSRAERAAEVAVSA